MYIIAKFYKIVTNFFFMVLVLVDYNNPNNHKKNK